MPSANSLGRRPKDTSAADLHERTAARSRGLDQRGSESSGADAQRAVAVNATDSKSQLLERLAVLPTLGLGDLRLEWRRLYRAEPPRLSRDIMMRAVAYRLQEIANGGLSKVTQRRLTTLAREFETGGTIAPTQGPWIKPGSRLVREWHGRTHVVTVSDAGFEFEGKAYRSLTKIALDITGAQWSGPRFFGLTKTTLAGTPKETSGGGVMIAKSANG
jgi:Protein of unknown function (DUF2924)